ncbi:hypothetical protein UA08_09035 [Talaromyces atroroseus]|uniref:N-acetyltransferase domain-containing protein n=1 Tax=Talaromyces atroroseus TaxID=1441469 RepID=A0A1Q5Q6Y4_TALAT|nr:hypothetical protein UA08_09035 [Talaromyces atroroseus]OKL55608.1 hypothetical protein UA08_09035 [Talaromyces atroroseus]
MPGPILENAVDAPIPAPKTAVQAAPLLAPIQATLKDDETAITLHPITPTAAKSLPARLVEYLHAEFCAEIERGCTYPMEDAIALERFREYWFGTFAVVVLKGALEQSTRLLQGQGQVNWEEVCMGTFYIKPNYPGRCSHVCNAGFLTCAPFRGHGIGSVMGKTYLAYAPKLGYKYSVFNLVFANNPASSRIWDKLGFEVLGRVPGAGRLRNSEELVDALIYGRSLV